MTDTPLDAHSAVLTGATFEVSYVVTGPLVPVEYTSMMCIPSKIVVTVTAGPDQRIEAQKVAISGRRAKKDGSPAQLGCDTHFYPRGGYRSNAPDWVMQIVQEAMDQVGVWLR